MGFFMWLCWYFHDQCLNVRKVGESRFHDKLQTFLLNLLKDLLGDAVKCNILISITSIRVQLVATSINDLL